MRAKCRIFDQRLIAPDQGSPVVGASQIGKEREYLLALQAHALELQAERDFGRRRGKQMTMRLRTKYPDRPSADNISGEVQRVHEQSR